MSSDTPPHYRTCPLCEGMCGVKITGHGSGDITVRPDPDNVWSQGHICPKGTRLGDLHTDPDRIRAPMVRDGDQWRTVTWNEAFARCETLLQGVLQRHGKAAVGAYLGNMIAKCFGLNRYVGEFLRLGGVQKIFSSATVDQHPKNLSCQLMYGNMWRIPVPDIDRTHLFVIFGGNPAASMGSMFSHPNVMEAIAELRKRGGRCVVVDPCRTGTAKKADQWIGIRPGTDAALLLAIVHTLFAEDRVRLRHLAGSTNGIDEVRELAAPFSPEHVTDFCGVDARVIRQLARDISDAPAAAVYGRIGSCTQEFGSLASWLIDVVAVLTGNLDREGGCMWSRELAPHLALTPPYPADAPVIVGRTRVRGAPIVLGQIPAGCFAEEMDVPGEGQLRALITVAANPALSAPSAGRVARGLANLECMISVDVYLNETTRHAHVILPTPSVLEQPHWDTWAWPFALKAGGHWSPPLYDPSPGSCPDWEIMLRLGALCSGRPNTEVNIAALDNAFFSSMCEQARVDPATAIQHDAVPGPERILDLAIRSGPFGDRYGEVRGGLTLADFKDKPHGMLVGVAQPCLADIICTPSGKIELAPPYLRHDIGRLNAAMCRPRPDMLLVSRRQLSSMNSWMHNVDGLMRGRHRCTLLLHRDDAARLGIHDGERVDVASAEQDSVQAVVELTDDIAKGVVSLPHGWGHDEPDTRLRVASRHAGINSNRLTAGAVLDVPSGNAVVNGIPVEIKRINDTAPEVTATL